MENSAYTILVFNRRRSHPWSAEGVPVVIGIERGVVLMRNDTSGLGKDELLDLLRRVHEMEEVMSTDLIDLVRSEAMPDDIPDDVKERLSEILEKMSKDTRRHGDTVVRMLRGETDG